MPMTSFSLEGKVALITGARRGIGRGIALTFAEAGADVAICDIVVEGGEMEAVAEEIKKLGRRSLTVQTDVTQKAQVDNLVKRVEDELGAIDILVNNVGVGNGGPILQVDEAGWDRITDINLKSFYLCCHAVGKEMVERKKGNIINISSIFGVTAVSRRILQAGVRAVPRGSSDSYCSAKAGVILLTRGLAWDLSPYNIRVNAICPGWIRTEFARSLRDNPERLKKVEAEIPLGRLGEPSEIGTVALFLASDASSYMTGSTIIADGGLLA